MVWTGRQEMRPFSNWNKGREPQRQKKRKTEPGNQGKEGSRRNESQSPRALKAIQRCWIFPLNSWKSRNVFIHLHYKWS
jgi:hypothetical protein